MADVDLKSLLSQIQPGDIRFDETGRVVVDRPDLAQKLKGIPGIGSPVAKDDTNIICCGNKKCGQDEFLGSIAERVSRARGLQQ